MKHLIALLIAVALVVTSNAQSPSPTPSASPTVPPISVPSPSVTTITQPISFQLSPAQAAQFAAAYGIPTTVKSGAFHVITSGSNTGGLMVILRFQ